MWAQERASPGMVLKIIRPDLKITLLDSLNKRLLFLNEVISQLGLQNISTVHMRAEDAAGRPRTAKNTILPVRAQ